MLHVIVLVCLAGTPVHECTLATAQSVVRGQTVRSPQLCGFLGQAQIAPSTLAPRDGEVMRIVCVHGRPPRTNVARNGAID